MVSGLRNVRADQFEQSVTMLHTEEGVRGATKDDINHLSIQTKNVVHYTVPSKFLAETCSVEVAE
jgi:hypothetical protein